MEFFARGGARFGRVPPTRDARGVPLALRVAAGKVVGPFPGLPKRNNMSAADRAWARAGKGEGATRVSYRRDTLGSPQRDSVAGRMRKL